MSAKDVNEPVYGAPGMDDYDVNRHNLEVGRMIVAGDDTGDDREVENLRLMDRTAARIFGSAVARGAAIDPRAAYRHAVDFVRAREAMRDEFLRDAGRRAIQETAARVEEEKRPLSEEEVRLLIVDGWYATGRRDNDMCQIRRMGPNDRFVDQRRVRLTPTTWALMVAHRPSWAKEEV